MFRDSLHFFIITAKMNEEAKYPTCSWGTMMWKYIAATLDKASIPSVMFGWNSLHVYGLDTDGFKTPDFVVADESLIDARSALVAAGFLECQDTLCDIKVNQGPFGSAVHLHIPATMCVDDIVGWNKGTEGIIRLQRHSTTLPKIADLNSGEYGGRQDIMLASDPENPLGISGSLHPIRVPSLHRFYEAVLLLLWENETWYCRDEAADSRCWYWKFVLRRMHMDHHVLLERLHREMLIPAMKLFLDTKIELDHNQKMEWNKYEDTTS